MPLAHKVLFAQIAAERPLSCRPLVVRPLMEQEISFQRERFAALPADERSFSRVAPHMVYQMLFPREGLRANAAAVRRLARMLSQMVR